MKFEVGDIVKGKKDSIYKVTNEDMTKGIVRRVTEDEIKITVLKHTHGKKGTFTVRPEYFEKIGHAEIFQTEKFFELLKESKEEALEYLEESDLRNADLSCADLSCADLRNVCPCGANLRSADLRSADLSYADLRNADLRNADLRNADLRNADLSGANLSCADLRSADLRSADLRNADLSGADLRNANLSYANLSCADLGNANLRNADLRNADLRSADLRNADLSGANLRSADLSGADLRSADLRNADLSYADLSGVKGLRDSIDFMEANFERNEEGYIVYKTFSSSYAAPESWKIEPGEVITEVCNPERTCECGCGINAASKEWVKRNYKGDIYRLLIRYEWLAGVVVPYNTDGKIRCSRAQIIEKVEAEWMDCRTLVPDELED